MWRICLLVVMSASVSGQTGKSQLPQCPGNETVCNALLHFPDRVIDQGRYCNGCANCSLPTDADADADALSASSFYWQHWEDPKLRVQFVKCSPMPQRPSCSDQLAQDRKLPAAVFVSPRSAWSPSLHQLRCVCQPPVYQLRSWRPDHVNWYYEFACHLPACRVPPETPAGVEDGGDHDGDNGADSVCAVKRRAAEDAPASVEFKCACPSEYHCVIKDVETKKSASEGNEGKAASDDDWQPETGGTGAGIAGGSGGQLSRRRCQKRHSSNSTTVLHR